MTETTTGSDRRAQNVALLGLIWQLASWGVLLGFSWWFDSHAIAAVSRFMLIGVPIWAVLVLVFKQIRRVEGEALETAELKRAREAGASSAIFELDDEGLLLEQNRLQWIVRRLFPSVTILLSTLLLGGHFLWWGWSLDEAFAADGFSRADEPFLLMWFAVGVGFLCFLLARYAIALSRLANWQLLHAGATCMAGNALACLGLALALVATGTVEWAEPFFAYLLRIALVVLGVEFAVNLILDFYRPRTPGEVPRPSFDSRLLGLISEPGDIAKSIAEAVNYQFGFEVSSTWFYQLLQRWLFPIMVVSFVAILALTSVVLVDADEQVVIERWGRPICEADGSERAEVLSPGFYVKLPYPIDIVHRAPIQRISELVLGEAEEEDDEDLTKAIIWTEAHEFVPELMLLVAAPRSGDVSDDRAPATPRVGGEPTPKSASTSESVPVGLLMVSVPIQYRIKNIEEHLYRYTDPVGLLEAVAYQYLSDYAASVDIAELMGPRREAFNLELKKHLQERVDELDLGIEIVFAGLRGAHPPAKNKVAAAYQGVLAAENQKHAMINAALGEARRIRTAVAGTETRAFALDEAILERNRLEADPDTPSDKLAAAEERVEDLLVGSPARGIAPPSGQAAALVAGARASVAREVSDAAVKARVFGTEVAAFEAAPQLYKNRKILEVYEGLGYVRKYLIVGDSSNVIIIYETAEEGGLDRVLMEGVEKERKK